MCEFKYLFDDNLQIIKEKLSFINKYFLYFLYKINRKRNKFIPLTSLVEAKNIFK